jgi:hypothetical protein
MQKLDLESTYYEYNAIHHFEHFPIMVVHKEHPFRYCQGEM